MKTLGTILFALAIGAGLLGAWIALSCMSWAAFQAFTWNDDDSYCLTIDD